MSVGALHKSRISFQKYGIENAADFWCGNWVLKSGAKASVRGGVAQATPTPHGSESANLPYGHYAVFGCKPPIETSHPSPLCATSQNFAKLSFRFLC
jgi:hypothetical protein